LAAAALILLALAVPAYLSTEAVARAETNAATSTDDALDDLNTAADLNPFATEPLIVRSTILKLDGQRRRALKAADEATERAPQNWAAWVVLAQASRAVGDRAVSRSAFERAARLNPRAPQLSSLRR
jgi:tetratricopeptide (TPR) repeat protein